MEIETTYKYDYDLDIVNVTVKQDYDYQKSIDLDTGVFLDFDKKNFPANLEILSASKRLNIKKDLLIKPNGAVKIIIIDDLIKLDVCFEINGEKQILNYTNKHEEKLKINNIEATFAIV